MTRLEIWFLHLTTALAGGTGLAYAILRYFVKAHDAFGVVNHPLEPVVQHLHILLTPLMVFAVGVIWRRHVWASWRSGQTARRRSGIGLALILAPMVVSGYLIQVVVTEGWRAAWVATHVALSLVWLVAYGLHWVTLRRGTAAGPVDAAVFPSGARWLLALLPLLVLLQVPAALLAAPRAAEVGAGVVERRLALMGTVVELSIEAESRPAALVASEQAIRALEATEARLSTWRDESELSRLNGMPVGEWMPLSAELAAELAAAQSWWRETGGAFDPGIGALIEAWGLRDGGRVPGAAERSLAVAAGGMASLELSGGKARRLKPGLRLEEGAFGKGAALDRAARVLQSRGVRRAVVDLGGQIMVVGEGEAVAIAIADPRRRERAALVLNLREGSVSTSGNSERGMMVGGRAIGHILDPERGEPVPDFGSVTVWAPDGITADCLSTGLYVVGPEAALAFAAERRGIEVLVIEVTSSPEEGKLRARATAGLRGRLKALVPDLELQFVPRGAESS